MNDDILFKIYLGTGRLVPKNMNSGPDDISDNRKIKQHSKNKICIGILNDSCGVTFYICLLKFFDAKYPLS